MSNYKNTSPAREVRAIKRLLTFLKKKSEYLQTTLSTSPPCPPKLKLSIVLLQTTSIPFLSFISLNNDLSFSNREVTILTSKSMSTVFNSEYNIG